MEIFERPDYIDTERTPLLKIVPESAKTVLDIGCNRGSFGRSIKASRDVEVWGVEPDLDSAKVARDVLDYVINDVFSDDNVIPEDYFDLITFNDSLEHMQDPSGALQLAKRKLKAGGRIHCCVPNVRHIDNIEHLLFEKDWKYESQGVRDRTHLRFFTEKSIVRLFESAGYRVVKAYGINEDWWKRRKYFRRLVFKLFNTQTEDMRYIQIVVIAEKI